MSLYKRKGRKNKKKEGKKENNFYWISITSPNGKRIRESTKTNILSKAKEYHVKRESEIWKQDKIGTKPERSWKETVVRYLKEKEHLKSQENLKIYIKNLDKYLGDKNLSEITTDLVNKIKYSRIEDVSQRHPNGKEYKISTGSVNKMLMHLGAIFKLARDEWEWIEATPKITLFPIKKGSKGNVIWLEKKHAKLILDELPYHLQQLMQFSLATGLRESNVTRLKWSQINLENATAWINPTESKNSCAIEVPLNEKAKKILKSQLGKHNKYVFTNKGKPIKKANCVSWRKALDRAGIRPYSPSPSASKNVKEKYPTKKLDEYLEGFENFRWHDLRHTWASWHVQSGTPLAVLQKLGCWLTFSMVLRYAHLGKSHVAEYSDNISFDYEQ